MHGKSRSNFSVRSNKIHHSSIVVASGLVLHVNGCHVLCLYAVTGLGCHVLCLYAVTGLGCHVLCLYAVTGLGCHVLCLYAVTGLGCHVLCLYAVTGLGCHVLCLYAVTGLGCHVLCLYAVTGLGCHVLCLYVVTGLGCHVLCLYAVTGLGCHVLCLYAVTGLGCHVLCLWYSIPVFGSNWMTGQRTNVSSRKHSEMNSKSLKITNISHLWYHSAIVDPGNTNPYIIWINKFNVVGCVKRPIDSKVIKRRRPHLLSLAKDEKLGFYTVPIGNRTLGCHVAVH